MSIPQASIRLFRVVSCHSILVLMVIVLWLGRCKGNLCS